MMRFGGVSNAFVTSSVCRDTQSIIKSGKPAIRLFLSLTIFPKLSGLAESIVISTLESAPHELAPHNLRNGHALTDRDPRLPNRV